VAAGNPLGGRPKPRQPLGISRTECPL